MLGCCELQLAFGLVFVRYWCGQLIHGSMGVYLLSGYVDALCECSWLCGGSLFVGVFCYYVRFCVWLCWHNFLGCVVVYSDMLVVLGL